MLNVETATTDLGQVRSLPVSLRELMLLFGNAVLVAPLLWLVLVEDLVVMDTLVVGSVLLVVRLVFAAAQTLLSDNLLEFPDSERRLPRTVQLLSSLRSGETVVTVISELIKTVLDLKCLT